MLKMQKVEENCRKLIVGKYKGREKYYLQVKY